jgi:pilus assembly protein CpaD
MKSEKKLLAALAPALSTPLRRCLAVSLLTVAVGACRHFDEGPQVAGWAVVDPSERHPIHVSQEPQTMQIAVGRYAQGLTGQQRAEVLAFADRSRASDAGNSRLIISAPGGAENEVAAMHVVRQIRRILSDYGFAETSIAVEAYQAEEGREPPIRVSYLRYVANAPQCGFWPTNLAYEPQNLPYPNLGCATQHNLAAQVANPADLLGPRTESDRSAERRDTVWDKYARGESTVAKKTEDERIKVKTTN